MVLIILVVVLFTLVSVVYAFFMLSPGMGGKLNSKKIGKIRSSPGYRDGRFQNVIETSLDMSPGNLYKSFRAMLKGGVERVPVDVIETKVFDREKFNTLGNDGEAVVCWFGHSSLLIKVHGKVFLTDPVIVGERASMFSFAGPKRFRYSHDIGLGQLPPIDAVLLSHDHYDHLDYPTIRSLKNSVTRFITPLGVGAHLEKWGVPASHISEYDWWDAVIYNDNIRLVCAPSRHFSGRSLTGRNQTLWCSWIISGRQQQLYFGADSGYSPTFREIGERFGPFDLTILECGAYSEYWPEIHMMPEETIQAHLDLKGRKLMPIHWGKFNLSLHAWNEPINRLQKKAAETGVAIFSPAIGQLAPVNDALTQQNWWKAS